MAREELDAARRETDAALAAGSVAQKDAHLRNAAHALDPDAHSQSTGGTGVGYGAIRALQSSIEHLEYAATSPDASENIVTSVAPVGEVGNGIVERLRATASQVQTDGIADAVALDRIAVELRAGLTNIAQGVDADRDGRIDASAAEAGIDQLHAQLQAMLDRENDPPYAPLPRKYLLGIVRLPDGKWIFTSIRKALSQPSYGHERST